jgi:serine/threonine protein phosphatase PrpC
VANVDGQGVIDRNDDRGCIEELDIKSLLELCPHPRTSRHSTGRRFSVGSSTDHDMHRRASYCEKSTRFHGHPFDSIEYGIGFACKKGLKPVSPNQDSFLVLRVEGHVSMYGVFDGHGRQGHDVSNFVKDFLPKLIVQDEAFRKNDFEKALLNGFQRTQELIEQETNAKKIDASASGTTCTIVIHKGNKLWVANVGDSRCVLASPCPITGEMRAEDATRDHKPDIPEERERINRMGGVVIKPPMDVNHRVYVKGFRFPGLAMSRALGDLIGYHRAGISATPEVNCYELKGDESLLLCSDGVWEFLSSQDAVELVAEELIDTSMNRQMEAAEKLCKTSWDKWIEEENGVVVDDITAIVVRLSNFECGSSLAGLSSRRESEVTED